MVVPAKLSRLVCDREKSLLTIVVEVACPDYDPGNQCKSLMLYEASWAIAVESVVFGRFGPKIFRNVLVCPYVD